MRVAIAGAGAVGRSIALRLLAMDHKVLLIELRRPSYRPELVPDADWMLADATELDTLERSAIHICDAVVAATGDDQANLVFSMLCKGEFAVPRVIARINNPGNHWLFAESWGVDAAVSTPGALVAAVETAVAVGDIVALTTVQHGGETIVEITLPATSALVGTTLSDLTLPPGAALVSIIRGATMTTPRPDFVLEGGDGMVLVATTEAQIGIRDIIRRQRPTA
jgi:trk system potassium uptake protein TrkA